MEDISKTIKSISKTLDIYLLIKLYGKCNHASIYGKIEGYMIYHNIRNFMIHEG